MSGNNGIVAGAAAGIFTLAGASHGSTGGADYAPILIGGLVSGVFALLVAVISVFGKEIADRALNRSPSVVDAHRDANDALVDALADEHATAEKLRQQVERLGATPDA